MTVVEEGKNNPKLVPSSGISVGEYESWDKVTVLSLAT